MLSLEYLAGYFDGEGTVGIYKVRSGKGEGFALHVIIANTYLPILVEIQEQFGGKIFASEHTSPQGYARRTMHHLRFTGASARNFLGQIYPHLREKKEQAELAINFPSRRGKKNRDVDTIELQEKLSQRIRQLKKARYSLL